jgi:transposase
MHSRITKTLAITLAGAAMCAAMCAARAAPAAKWQWLFDGKLNDSFRGWRSDGLPEGWHVAHGTLAKKGSVDDLVTREQFGNFELTLEWKIGKRGNSGIFYRGTREYDHIYWSAPEYQLLDDENAPDGRNRLTAAGAAYALYAAPAGVVKPFGKWNSARIVCAGTHVEHWMNGQLVVAYDLQSADWKAKVAASKFSQYPNYGLAMRGFIGIQGDHSGALALRRIRIRELP